MKDREKNKGQVLNKQNGWKKDKRTMLRNNTTREGGRSEETMARETVYELIRKALRMRNNEKKGKKMDDTERNSEKR